jgi:hypothetical protein
MVQRSENLRLAGEAGSAVGVGEERIGKDFESDVPA